MPEDGRIIRQIDLSNGLRVTFHDCSQAIVGDRSQVRLLITIPIAVKPAEFETKVEKPEALRRFVEKMGGCVEFQTSQTRNFISNDKKASLLQQMTEEFLRTNIRYLSHPEFPTRYVLKRFSEWEREDGIKRAYQQALIAHDQNE